MESAQRDTNRYIYEHHAFLQLVCDAVDRLTEEHCPKGLNPQDIKINIKLVTGNNPLGDHIRLLGNAVMVKLTSIKWDSPPLVAGVPRNQQRLDKFLHFEETWVNLEHMSSASPGKDIDIEGRRVKTCYVAIMEDSLFRIQGTCEEFFDSIHFPLVEYLESQNQSHSDDEADDQTKEEHAEE